MPPNENPDGLSPAVDDAKRAKKFTNTTFALGVGALLHPMQFSKVLIQLGYEPFPLEKGRAWHFCGGEKRYLPNVFVYTRRIYQDYGLSSVYRGVGASICGNFAGAVTTMFVSDKLSKYYGIKDDNEGASSGADPTAESAKFVKKVARDSVSKVAGIIVARPFQVVMIRMIAQHVGGEDIYKGVFCSIRQIYKEEGVSGLFAGLIPQIFCDLCIYWTVSSVSYLLEHLWKSYVEREDRDDDDEEDRLEATPPKTFKSMIYFAVPYVVNSIFYPLQLTSTIMAVNGSGLVAGLPPFVPIYSRWQECLQDLAEKDQLKRGAKMFFRFYEKPITYRYGGIYAVPNA